MLSVLCWWLLALLVAAIIRAITVEKVVAEEFLDAVKKLLDKSRQFGFDSHLKYVEVFVGAQLLIILICLYLLYNKKWNKSASALHLEIRSSYHLPCALTASTIKSLFLLLLTVLMILFRLSSISSL